MMSDAGHQAEAAQLLMQYRTADGTAGYVLGSLLHKSFQIYSTLRIAPADGSARTSDLSSPAFCLGVSSV